MPIVVVFQSPSLTKANYEESVRRLTGGKSRVESWRNEHQHSWRATLYVAGRVECPLI